MGEIHIYKSDVIREGFELPASLNEDLMGAYARLKLNGRDITVDFTSCITQGPAASSETSINGCTKGYVDLPFYFLIEPSEIDPKYKKEHLTDEELKKFFDESRARFSLPPEEFSFKYKLTTGLFLAISRNEEMGKKARLFIIGHELGHIKHQHVHDYPTFFSKRNLFVFLASLVLTIGLGLILNYCGPHHLSNLKVSLGAIGFGGGSTLTLIVVTCLNIRNSKKSKATETEADITHAALSKEAYEGGIYLLETTKKYLKNLRSSSWLVRLLTTEEGDRRFNISHPSFSDRTAALKRLPQPIN